MTTYSQRTETLQPPSKPPPPLPPAPLPRRPLRPSSETSQDLAEVDEADEADEAVTEDRGHREEPLGRTEAQGTLPRSPPAASLRASRTQPVSTESESVSGICAIV